MAPTLLVGLSKLKEYSCLASGILQWTQMWRRKGLGTCLPYYNWSPRTVHGRIIGPPWDHPWCCKQSPLAVIGPTSCSLAQVTDIHWRVNYEARKHEQTRMKSLHRPSGGHVVQVIVSGAHNAPDRIYKSRMHDSYSYLFPHGLAQSMQPR